MDRPSPESFNEQLIEEIIAKAEKGFDKDGYETTTLHFGRMELIITFWNDSRLFKTHVENKQKDQPKTQSEITPLYMAAKRIMQRLAQKNGFRLHYRIETKFPKMAKWALTIGDSIFHWTRTSIDRDDIKHCPDDQQLKELNVFWCSFDPNQK